MYTCFFLLAFIIFETTFLKINFKYKSCNTLIHPSQKRGTLLFKVCFANIFRMTFYHGHIFLFDPENYCNACYYSNATQNHCWKAHIKLLIQNRTKQLRCLSHCRSLPNVKMNFCFKMFFVVLYFTIRIIQICMSSKIS